MGKEVPDAARAVDDEVNEYRSVEYVAGCLIVVICSMVSGACEIVVSSLLVVVSLQPF